MWAKGIYDVDAFERSVDERIPENSVLSHDLLEGLMGRAGLGYRYHHDRGLPARITLSRSCASGAGFAEIGSFYPGC